MTWFILSHWFVGRLFTSTLHLFRFARFKITLPCDNSCTRWYRKARKNGYEKFELFIPNEKSICRYQSSLRCQVLGWVAEENQTVFVQHFISSVRPTQLRSRLESNAGFSKHGSEKNSYDFPNRTEDYQKLFSWSMLVSLMKRLKLMTATKAAANTRMNLRPYKAQRNPENSRRARITFASSPVTRYLRLSGRLSELSKRWKRTAFWRNGYKKTK